MTTRSAQLEDLPLLAEYWYDQAVLLSQYNPHVRLLAQAQQRWQQAAAAWLASPAHHCLVAERDAVLLGGITGAIVANSPGLAPEQLCRVLALVIDMHTPQAQHGIGRVLLSALKQRLAQQHITRIMITVAPNASIEHAFWRAQGARRAADDYWLAID